MSPVPTPAGIPLAPAARPPHPARELWRHFRQNRGAVVGLAVVLT